MSKIHSSAVISPDAKIAEDVEIGAFAVIGENVTLEKGVVILPHAYVENSVIGEGTVISSGAIIGTEPQDLSYKGEKTGVVIGKNCQLREYVTVNRAAKEGVTRVGDNCLLMIGAHVGHNTVLEDNVILANQVTLAGHCYVETGVFLGGMIVIHQNCRIGKMSIMSGFSGSRQDVPPFSKTDGRPAVVAGMNTIGMKRKGFSQEERRLIKEAYKYLFYSNLNTTQALEKIEETLDCSNEHIKHLVEFVRASKRGIVKAPKKGLEVAFLEE